MHQSPTTIEKNLFLDQGRLKIYSFGLVSSIILFTGNIYFIIAFPFMWAYAIIFLINIFYLALSYFVGFSGKSFDSKAHDDLVSLNLDKVEKASIDIYLPICKEPIEVILNTWEHVKAMLFFYPNAKVYVLDDGKDPEAKAAAKIIGFEYITREDSSLKKAGNLRNAFTKTSGEFIAIFDADFCPRMDFFYNTIPYFLKDSSVGVVQTPQYFDNDNSYSWIRNAAGSVQELFYRLIQVNRNTFGGSICVGTNAVYRRKHLEPFGGTAPIAYSEDVHTGFQLLANKNKIVYIPVNLALGACPDTIKQFFTQQYRWSLGSISLLISKKFWSAKITLMQRICYMTGMFFYISTGISTVTIFLPSIFILVFFPEKMHYFNLAFSIPSLIFSVLFMKYWQKAPMNLDVLRARQISYFAHLFAMKDLMLNTLEEWKPTGAKTTSSRYDSFMVFFTTMALAVPLITLSLIIIRLFQGHDISNFALLIMITAFNAYINIPVIDDL